MCEIMLLTMKSKLFNSLLDLVLDIILWIMREKDDHRTVPLPNPTAANPKETGFLVAADGFIGQVRNQDGGQKTQIHLLPTSLSH
jgi:hypothetical protein